MNKTVNINDIVNLVTPQLLNCLIYHDEDGSYKLFEQYQIVKKDNMFIVHRYRDEKQFQFFKLKHATAWSILDKYNKFHEANKILELDLKLESVKVDKLIHAKMKKKSKHDYLIHIIKYDQDVLRQNKFQRELDKYIVMAKMCQERGFQNELNRSSRKKKEQIGN